MAAIVAALLRDGTAPGGLGPVRCCVISPAAVFSGPLSEACRPFITSLVLRYVAMGQSVGFKGFETPHSSPNLYFEWCLCPVTQVGQQLYASAGDLIAYEVGCRQNFSKCKAEVAACYSTDLMLCPGGAMLAQRCA